MTEAIQESVSNGVQVVLLNRPDKKNAITVDMYQAMSDVLHQAELRDEIKVTIIAGAGPDFSAGNDINDFVEIARSPEKMASVMSFLQALTSYKKPLIGCVEGWAVGVGATMMLHCDMVFAAKNTQFVFPFVQLGLVPEAASSFLLPKIVGHQRAFEMLMFGEPINAETAYQWGMVNHLCEPKESLELANLYAQKLCQLPTEAVLLSKDLLKCRAMDDIQMALMREGRIFKDRLVSDEAQQQFYKFLKKES
ncbi:MAG: enoyl-CoA hydratase [Marinomonas sp.]|uniref:enoyl-CoA hydratase-related protein n=1 Tax=Marinomonas communis TaxID=28254 RepID=UPI0010015060|nr:enoyl-CoA hydratase-related protein [Marinomonas communis]MCC4275029.1 enoyl-CoA hydratase/isomerase family protein [Marinomonas communis]RUM55471.1 MAG: enoyl-CoA hydratase [Marinomonas sp.]